MNFMPKNNDELSIHEQLRSLIDERDIRNVLHRWCRAIDRIDVELMKTCFHEDAVDHHAPLFECTAKQLADFLVEGTKQASLSMKYMTGNVLIDIEGDIAKTESLIFGLTEIHKMSRNGNRLLRLDGFRYLDRFERRNGNWRIAERWYIPGCGIEQEIVDYMSSTDSISPDLKEKLIPIQSKRDRSDQSYLI